MTTDETSLIYQWCEEYEEGRKHLQKLCLSAGCEEKKVMSDGYGVPTIQDLADMLGEQLSAAREDSARLREALSTIIEEENAQGIRSYGLGDIAHDALNAVRTKGQP